MATASWISDFRSEVQPSIYVSLANADIITNSGGPAGLIYGYLLVWMGSLAVFTSLSELASMYASNLDGVHDELYLIA